jgi:hypothetical protein
MRGALPIKAVQFCENPGSTVRPTLVSIHFEASRLPAILFLAGTGALPEKSHGSGIRIAVTKFIRERLLTMQGTSIDAG